MSQTIEEIAKDMVVAWIAHNNNLPSFALEHAGEKLGVMFKAVAKAVHEEQLNRRMENARRN
jgi:hypothetical protein